MYALGSLAVVGAIACSGGVSSDPAEPVDQELNRVYSGTLVVGEDIQPGTYKSVAAGFCYIARLSATENEYGTNIIDNYTFEQGDQVLLDVLATDYAVEIGRECNISRETP